MKWVIWIICVLALPSVALAGPTTVERKSQFEKALSLIMASSTPRVSAWTREDLIEQYSAAKPNKGQAVQLTVGSYWRSSVHEDQVVAAERTLEGCQLRYEKPCALLALNDEIEGELIAKDMPRLHYVGKYDVSQIPIIRLVARKRPDVQNYDRALEPKAMVIHPRGQLFISVGSKSAKEAQETALARCNNDRERNGRDGGCFVYAVNNDVVLSERRANAK